MPLSRPPTPDAPSVSVIIPAYNAAGTLPHVLAALAAVSPPVCEIIVVDDGSTDETDLIAQSQGACVVQLGQNQGAAVAKNRGAAQAHGDILFFTDSDILVPADLCALLAHAFAQLKTDGVVGLLGPHPKAQDWASQFKNLWMNFTYARFTGHPRIGLFYTSVAAMRRQAFHATGGFDENYRGASIAEDTEFGQRAWGQGLNILLEPRLRVIHLKSYTPISVLREDFRRARALTLMRFRKRGQPFFTSVPLSYQLAVPTLYLCLLAFAVGIVSGSEAALGLGLVLALAFYLLNLDLLRYLAARRGLLFALQSALFLPVDVFVVGLGMLAALLDFVRGMRY